jgi:hypothetical protein
MTIEQLLQSDVAEEVKEAIFKLIRKLNELNTIPNKKYHLSSIVNMGRVLPEIYEDEEDIEE